MSPPHVALFEYGTDCFDIGMPIRAISTTFAAPYYLGKEPALADAMVSDVQDLEWRSDSKPKADFWSSHFLRRLPTPKWTTRQENLPLLANPAELAREWRIRFVDRAAAPEIETFAFEATPKAVLRFVAVAAKKTQRPDAWLIYFRHTAQRQHFKNDLLELGGGDYLIGRMQVKKQMELSGKNVGVIIPLAFGSSGEFAGNQPFVTQCLHEIETNLYGSSAKTPLLAASNSDGIFQLHKFIQGCPTLIGRLKGIYDFDGSFRVGTGGISLAVKGAKTFRYEGANSPTSAAIPAHETDEAFLRRTMGQNPARIPLALSRWREHGRFKEVRPQDDPKLRHKKGDLVNEAKSTQDKNWLHHHIPACMLHHGLMNTPGL